MVDERDVTKVVFVSTKITKKGKQNPRGDLFLVRFETKILFGICA
jgi:hypothetical protein